jgi:ATP-dependent helicase/nuclease subunit B
MSLRLVYGRAGSGKSSFCLNDIKAKHNDGENTSLILVVPEQFTLQAEKNLVKAMGSGGIMRAEVLSFRRMAYRVFNEVGGIVRRHINSAGKCMLIYRVIDCLKDELSVFSKAVRQQGFVGVVSELIAELKRYNITPQDLMGVCEKAGEDELLKSKLSDIVAIYDEFENRLHERYIDADDDLTELAKKVHCSNYLGDAEIWIDEFTGFTPQEYKVIEELLNTARRVNICLCSDCLEGNCDIDGTDVFAPARRAAAKLMSIAKQCNVEVETPVCISTGYGRFKSSKEISHLEKNFFSYPYNVYKHKTIDVRMFMASNTYSEVEDTARDIICLCRDRGMRFRDIAVVTRNLEAYEGLIKSVFSEYGIPFFIDMKRSISDHPLVRLILSALEIFGGNWSYESVFRYLKTGLTGISREDIDIIENYVLAFGIRGGRWTQAERWEYRMSNGFEEHEMGEYERTTINRVNEIRALIISPLVNFRIKVKGKCSAREICTALYQFLCDIGVPERIEGLTEEFKSSGQLELAVEYSQVWNIVMEVFDQIVEVSGDEGMGLGRFSNILQIGLGEYKVGLIPLALDQVLVGSVERSKSHEISALYILGVNDGVFPAASNDEGILSDKDRETLRTFGMELAYDTRTRGFEEQYLVYSALTTAGNYLRLSYPAADHEGRTMRPSMIISRLRKLFPVINECSDIIESDADDRTLRMICAAKPTFNRLVCAVRKHVDGNSVNNMWWDVLRWYNSSSEWREKCRMMLLGITYTNQVGMITPERTRKLYGSPIYTSISRLETFRTCPFSFFVQYGLKVKERRIFKLEPPDIGTFMHHIIDKFSKSVADKGINWRTLEKDWCSAEVSRIVDELLENAAGSVFNSTKRYRYLSQRLKRVLARAVWLIAEHIKRSSFEPLGYEMTFGKGGEFPPITIELPSGEKINLTGRIDRIDAMKTEEGTYLRIIDYKSGKKAFALSDVYYGLQLQLTTYMDAIWENGGKSIPKPIIPGGMFYFRVDDPVIKAGKEASEEEVEKAIMKKLKMNGLLLADVKLIKEMDREIDGHSLIIPARINKGDVLGKSSAATLEQFELLRKHARKLLAELGNEMLHGNISIKPYKKKGITSCSYCRYTSVCHFDPALKNNTYTVLNELKEQEVWEMIKNEQMD